MAGRSASIGKEWFLAMSDRARSSETSVWEPVDLPESEPLEDPRSTLSEIETIADEWIIDNLDQFDPFSWTALSGRNLRRKAFTELALHLYVARGVGETYSSSEPHDLVVDRANDRRYRDLVRRNPRELLKYTHPLTYAKVSGDLDGATATAVDSVLDQQTVWSVERVPHRQMDLWHFCLVYGYADCPIDKDAVLPLGSLNHPPNVANADLSDLYAVTHNLYYYHNFGVDHPAFPDDIAPYDLTTALVGGILRYIAVGNCDIVLELLLAGVLQRQVPPDLVRFALAWVRHLAAEPGYLPGPDEKPAELPSGDLESWGSEDREWARHYHTNLVGATATKVIKSRADWPELAESGDDYRPSAELIDRIRLGQFLHSLSQYTLGLAARQLKGLVDADFSDPYATVLETGVRYLRQQQSSDGQYGFWTDEEAVYTVRGNNRDAFREQMVQPVTEACSEAIEKYSNSGSETEDGPG
ncbi:MAG: hypothetical protein ABEI27_03480 [Halobellus sp.]|uniref:DUF6895 family protein n=1 Tax=Halobellus sp. TaxID=1979212 RepID=UPI0035D4E0E2